MSTSQRYRRVVSNGPCNKGGRSGPSTIVCDECGQLLDYDYLNEYWYHIDTGKEECINTGQQDEQPDEPNAGQAEADDAEAYEENSLMAWMAWNKRIRRGSP